MKKILSVLYIATLLFASCSDEYDDSALTGRVDNLENRVAKLEELCKQMNTNISSLQTIVTALQNNDYITEITPVMQDGIEIGYTIRFNKSNPITIYHGKDGQNGTDGSDGKPGTDGQDGHTPVISVKQDTDGVYYWTLDGDWLTDDSGNKIKIEGTDGQDGVTPRLKIEEGCWYISYDNEQSWSPIEGNSDVTDCIFTDIEDLSDQVIFYLKDGTTIVLPKQIQEEFLNITFGDIEKLPIFPGMTHEIEYVISEADEQTIIEVVAQDNYKAHVQPIDNQSGKIIIQAPTTDLVDSRILVFVSKQQQTIMRVIRTTEGIFSVTSDAYEVEYTSAELSITVETNVDYTLNIDPKAQEWLSLPKTRTKIRTDRIIIAVSENTTGYWRSADIVFLNSIGETIRTITIAQKPQKAADIIIFADQTTKEFCVQQWDQNRDGELSKSEAASVCYLKPFPEDITSFDELSWFTSINTIPDKTFENCRSLITVTIPQNVTSIGRSAFAHCENIRSIIMSPNVTRIEDDAFNNCHNLEQLEIPKNVSYIGKRAFQNCAGDLFIDCDIPSAKNMFADAPFWGSYFSSITIGPHVNTIGELAFYQAGPNLTRINISEGVKTIERMAFSSNGHLLEINIPQSVTEIGEHAFSGCTGRLKINCNIPSYYVGTKDGRPFEANRFTSIIIGENVDIIGDYAFLESSDLIELTLVYGTTKIGNSAFCLCEQLRAINISGSVVEIGEKAFEFCENTTEVIIPSSVREIGNDAFAYCSGILHMNCNVPSSTDASSKIFDCSTFSSVIFGESVTSIGERAFENCETIKTLQFPQNLLNIGYCAFSGCSSLTMDLEIPQNVTTIGAWAFSGCHFRSLTIPQSVVDIEASAFSASAGDIENSTLYINCQIPSIENYLDDSSSPFSSTGFDHIVIGDGITTIGAGAFDGTSYIASLTLPASLKTIEERAFKDSHITTIYCKASIPPQIKKESPWTTISLLECIVYVPESCRNAYINDSYWKSAQAIEEIIY